MDYIDLSYNTEGLPELSGNRLEMFKYGKNAIWEDMKQEYLERTRATATSARVPATAPAPSPAPLDANPETDAADGPPRPRRVSEC